MENHLIWTYRESPYKGVCVCVCVLILVLRK